MDATRMAFADGRFDCVVAPYVLTVVPDPETLLDELARVVKPGGDILLVNHVSGRDDPLAILEKWLDRHVAPRLGWRPQFPWSIIGDWIDQRDDMTLIERRPLAPFGMFSLVRIRRTASETAAGEETSGVDELAFA
jgi:phosphatidylethanolamine/phosphatidyl-N-methylethanolamine N-methyltransferase